MCSFDVNSLFTNLLLDEAIQIWFDKLYALANPLDEAIQIWFDKLYALANPPSLPRLVLKNLLLFATKKSHFVFDGQYYD